METKALAYRNWDELVFENRNKNYGAYVLRKSYNDKVLLGLGVSVVILALLFFASDYTGKPITKTIPYLIERTIDVLPPPVFKIEFEAQRIEPPKPSNNHNSNLPPLVVNTPVSDSLQNNEPVSEPVVNNSAGEPSSLTGNTSGTELPVVKNTEPFNIVEIMPVYEGGLEAMGHFLQKHLRYPRATKNLGIEGTVYVSFVVNGNGSVRDVTVVRGIHPDCDKEAIRVVSLLPGWNGGRQGGAPVPVRMVLPIKFKIS